MALKTITQLRIDFPTVTLAGSDLFALDQTLRTVAATLTEIKAFVRPDNVTTTVDGLMTATDKVKLNGVATGATANATNAELRDRATHTGTQTMATVAQLVPRLDGRQPGATSLVTGGLLSINADPAKINISAGTALFSDYTAPDAPVGEYVDFGPASAVVLTNLATHPASYIGINAAGTIVQQTTPFTPTQRRTVVPLGLAIHSNNTAVNVVNTVSSAGTFGYNQLQDFMDAVGPLNISGNVYASAATALTLSRSAGSVFKHGANYPVSALDPHRITMTAETPVTIRYRLRNSTEYADATNVDPDNYDLAGVLTTVPNNKWTIQRITLFQSGLTRIQYGQTLYDKASDALAALTSEAFVVEPNIGANGIQRAFLVVKKGATNLADTTQALFVEVGKFGAMSSTSAMVTAQLIIDALGYTPVAQAANGSVDLAGPIKFEPYVLSALPSAATFSGYLIEVTDAAGGPTICRSNGTDWKILNTTTTVT